MMMMMMMMMMMIYMIYTSMWTTTKINQDHKNYKQLENWNSHMAVFTQGIYGMWLSTCDYPTAARLSMVALVWRM